MIPAIFDDKEIYTTRDSLYLTGFIVTIGTFLNLLITIRNQYNGLWLLLYLVLIAILTDTFAYIIGMLIGKHKIIPSVSSFASLFKNISSSPFDTATAVSMPHVSKISSAW